MGIAQDLHDRLRAALPAQVPVLLPDEFREPLDAAPLDAQGRPAVGKGERGLGLYLQRHPQGYVQVYDPQGLLTSLDGAAGLWLVQIACLAPTAAALDALTPVALTVTSRAGVRITPYELTTPASRSRGSGHVIDTFILTARQGT